MEGSAIDQAQREAEQRVTVAPPAAHAPDLVEEVELGLLREIRDGVAQPSLALTDVGVPPSSHNNFPAPGSSRIVVPRQPTGGRVPVTSLLAPKLVLAANSMRLAGTITNMGKADALLILAPAEEASGQGISLIYLIARGGSWDLRLGPPLWCGSVSALALKTSFNAEVFEETELAVAEV
jgi:hypothetical protein